MLDSLLHLLLTFMKLRADARAVARSRIPQRAFNRVAGKASRAIMRRVWR